MEPEDKEEADAKALDTGAEVKEESCGPELDAGAGVDSGIWICAGAIGTNDCAGGSAEAVDVGAEVDDPIICASNAGVS